jgi:surface carbohydrate biosynthesis protein
MYKVFNKSISFKIPIKSSIILYSKSSKVLKKTLNEKYTSKICIDRNEINLFIFILTLLNGRISFLNYVKTFIKFVDPKIIITFTDSDIDFYKLKFFYPNKFFISVQNGHRIEGRDPFFTELIKAKKKKISLEIDYYLVFNNQYAKFIKKFIKCKTFEKGSYRNNLIKIKKNKKISKDLLFISQYFSKAQKNISNKEHSIFYSVEKKLLTILKKYCLKNKLNLIILLRGAGPKAEDEKNFYNSFLKNNFKGLREKNAYNFIDKYENIFTIDSTLGYEALVRKKKVFFFRRPIKIKKKYYKHSYRWPISIKENNFTTDDISEKNIFRILKKNLNINYNKWLKINNKHFNNLMIYEYKNKTLLELIKKCLKVETTT